MARAATMRPRSSQALLATVRAPAMPRAEMEAEVAAAIEVACARNGIAFMPVPQLF